MAIINKLVFIVKNDMGWYVDPPSYKLTANNINRDFIYLISPVDPSTSIKATFKADLQGHRGETASFKLSDIPVGELVNLDKPMYKNIEDWNVWLALIPSKALSFISHNRAGRIGMSFQFTQSIARRLPNGVSYGGKITSENEIDNIENGWGYIIKGTGFFYADGETANFNDLVYRINDELYKIPAIKTSTNTGTVNYSVDPSVYDVDYEEVDYNLTEELLQMVNEAYGIGMANEEALYNFINFANQELDRSAKVDEENVFTERQEFIPGGIYTSKILMDSDARIEGLGDGTNPQDAVNKSQLDKKVDKITEAQKDSLGIVFPEDRIVYGVDYNLNEMPIKASITKRENTIVMRDGGGEFQDLYEHNTNQTAHSDEFNKKVDKTQTIIGLDLQDNILIGEFRTALGNATQSVAGLLSAEDKTHLDGLVGLLETSDGNNVVDTIGEILEIFQNYPEGADLVTVLQGKVDKVTGKGLSTNDFTDALKDKLYTLETSKQDKLIAGDNITIDENTNVISASGKGFHRVRIFSDNNKLVTAQILYEGEKVLPLDKQGNLFDFGTRNPFDYDTVITEDLDLTYSAIPLRYVQTTTSDFNESGDYTGTASYIILPADKPSGYRIRNINVIGVATNGDYLTSTSEMFYSNPSLYLELDYLDTSNVTDMRSMFSESQATNLDLSSFDTNKVTDMSFMFNNSQVTTIDLTSFDTSNVTNMNNMFRYSQATNLDLSSFDTNKVTDMSFMFNNSQATTIDLTSFDTSSVINMLNMFYNSQATTLDLSSFDTSNVTDMRSMFSESQATNLDLSSFDTNKVTDMSFMFYNSQATTLDLSSFDTSNVTNMNNMFRYSQATTGYARTQTDADNFNNSNNKPSTLTFVVK